MQISSFRACAEATFAWQRETQIQSRAHWVLQNLNSVVSSLHYTTVTRVEDPGRSLFIWYRRSYSFSLPPPVFHSKFHMLPSEVCRERGSWRLTLFLKKAHINSHKLFALYVYVLHLTYSDENVVSTGRTNCSCNMTAKRTGHWSIENRGTHK
jgi:hypothetical protein